MWEKGFILIFFVAAFAKKIKQCQDEMVQDKFLWSYDPDLTVYDRNFPKDLYRSTPSCYNSEENLIVRSCKDGEWSPKAEDITKCLMFNETSPKNLKCPEEVKEIALGGDEFICLEISEAKERYDLHKNIRNSLHSLSKKHLQSMNITDIWSSTTIIDNFSAHCNLTVCQYRLLPFSEIYKSRTKKCFVEKVNTKALTQSSCDENVYSVREFYPSRLSIKSACPENTAAYIFHPSVCAGVKPGAALYDFVDFIQSNNWIENAWDNFFRSFNNLQLDTSNTSFVRPSETYYMEFPNGIYKGEHSETIPFLNKFQLDKVNVFLDLSLNANTGFLEVSCENCKYLYKFDGGFEGFSCFTTDREGNPKLVNRMEKMVGEKWSIRYDQEKEGFRFYWCQGFSIFNFKMIQSPKVKAGWLRNGSEAVEFDFSVGMSNTKTSKSVLESMSNDSILSNIEILRVTSVDQDVIKLLVSKVIYNSSIEEFRNYTLENYHYIENFRILENTDCKTNIGSLKEILQSSDKNSLDKSFTETLGTLGQKNTTSMDILYVAAIFDKLDTETVRSVGTSRTFDNILKVIDLLSNQPSEIFKEAVHTNQTNVLSKSVENLIDNFALLNQTSNDYGIHYMEESKFSVYTLDPSRANVTGLIILKEGCEEFRPLFKNMSRTDFKSLNCHGIDFAFYLPEELLSSFDARQEVKIVLKIYKNDNFFKSNESTKYIEDNIYSISIPGHESHFRNNTIPMLFHSRNSAIKCNYWNYESGGWDSAGISNVSKLESDLFYCETNHLTSFTKVVSLENIHTPLQEFWLHVVTMFCLLLSGVSIFVMYILSALSKTWRNKNLSVLNTSTAILVQILVFASSDYKIFSKYCAVFGFMIQYSVLVEFVWMFLYIWATWEKFSKPFHNKTRSIVVCVSLAWFLPLIPVVVAYVIDGEYCTKRSNDSICFPSPVVKFWTFLFPMIVILIANLLFFTLLVTIFRKILKDQQKLIDEKRMNIRSSKREVFRNTVFNIFAIGLPWIFGIVHNFRLETYSSFIFVTLVPLQGTILFIYKVIMANMCVSKRIGFTKNLGFRKYPMVSSSKYSSGSDRLISIDSSNEDQILKECQNLSSTFVGLMQQIK